jgi:hypothetical protein
MANLAFNQNGMIKPRVAKPMPTGLTPGIAGPGSAGAEINPLAPPMSGGADDLGAGGVVSRPPVNTDRPIPGKPMLGGGMPGMGRPPTDFGGMTGYSPMGGGFSTNALLPTDPNSGPGGGQRSQALQALFGQPRPTFGGFGGNPGFGGGMTSAPAPDMGGGGMTATNPGLLRRRGFDPGLR